ncbi:hypothetical protein K503DRAFT_803336 [Rhizopogon vinicolor AM-OR11-026]|uniref:Uncharacterized protein n=1 Tax=Rhizopogon vinicolor AM-OR11-026 TaxID=1314800 RepID=A0A1B7MQ89_9AGAM|nr:hypothetical protein K503DRAFT_803336 [Rhizopogon vinicolor AM-OR11-026]
MLGASDNDERLEVRVVDGIIYSSQGQTTEDQVMRSGFGTVIDALGICVKPYLTQIVSSGLWQLNNKRAKSSYLDFNYLVPASYSRFSIKDPPVEELTTLPSFTPPRTLSFVNPTLQEVSSSEAIPTFALTTLPYRLSSNTSLLDSCTPSPLHDLSNLSVPPSMTIELAPKAGAAKIVGRTPNALKDKADPYR